MKTTQDQTEIKQELVNQFEDFNIEKLESIQRIHEEFLENVKVLYKKAIDLGIIKEGDPAPWQQNSH